MAAQHQRNVDDLRRRRQYYQHDNLLARLKPALMAPDPERATGKQQRHHQQQQ